MVHRGTPQASAVNFQPENTTNLTETTYVPAKFLKQNPGYQARLATRSAGNFGVDLGNGTNGEAGAAAAHFDWRLSRTVPHRLCRKFAVWTSGNYPFWLKILNQINVVP
jgi:hypothetical protein